MPNSTPQTGFLVAVPSSDLAVQKEALQQLESFSTRIYRLAEQQVYAIIPGSLLSFVKVLQAHQISYQVFSAQDWNKEPILNFNKPHLPFPKKNTDQE